MGNESSCECSCVAHLIPHINVFHFQLVKGDIRPSLVMDPNLLHRAFSNGKDEQGNPFLFFYVITDIFIHSFIYVYISFTRLH